ncbi:Signal transduction histidine kinase [Pseudomonas cuatrocienegasensis]|uniref:histidine kinase n=1 Tax=Pseudomonas cuatrocienegasensis TaxID=543360 RepID=A0ABY1AZM5_9PSED|nr:MULTISPECIES: ATP-binding protein [Pseudomonas]OEC36238.1 two-component sensor histidine kinase [Pseudomonas sp. 21C1]SEP58903.1 Signal transduction histidine kinase [Pseudomonas cuatrocienegasensis]
MRFASTLGLNSLAAKVLLAYIAGAVLTTTLMVLAVVSITTSQSALLSDAEVADTTKELADDLLFDRNGIPIGLDIDDFDVEWVFDSLKQETAYRVLDTSGKVVLSAPTSEVIWPESAAGQPQPGSFTFEQRGVTMHGATEAVEHDGRTWYLQFTASTRFFHLVYRAFAMPFTGLGITLFSLMLLFVFGASVYVTLKYSFKPLRDISTAAAGISPRSLHARLQSDTVPTEIAPLVDSFNKVLERLEHGYRVQQEFLATAAHELKTPLALIRAQIELIDHGHERESLLNDVEHMTRQVHQLLHLAEASELQSYRFASVNIRDLASEAVNYLQRMADTADVRLVMSGDSEQQWLADRGALFTLLKNLLENAIQHAPGGSEVHLEVRSNSLTLRDWGPGVEAEQLVHLFVRFWRGAHRRDHGAGLGLAICQEIATAHSWTLTAQRAEPGLIFQLSRPENGPAPESPLAV